MPPWFNLETFKLIGSISIVVTAVCIMLPGFLGYAFSLAKLSLIILIAVLVSSTVAFTYQFLLKRNKTNNAEKESNSAKST
ncbi:MAG: hypothetical protein K2X27_16785 [Candidatus Obscuribacterales bacterium]|nr:hypothetical protein [Candidatus Obscuribacterales bacterium]